MAKREQKSLYRSTGVEQSESVQDGRKQNCVLWAEDPGRFRGGPRGRDNLRQFSEETKKKSSLSDGDPSNRKSTKSKASLSVGARLPI